MKEKKRIKVLRIPVRFNQTGAGIHKDKKKEANKKACRKSRTREAIE